MIDQWSTLLLDCLSYGLEAITYLPKLIAVSCILKSILAREGGQKAIKSVPTHNTALIAPSEMSVDVPGP